MKRYKGERQGFGVEFVLIGIVVLAIAGAAFYFFTVAGPKQAVNKIANEYLALSIDGKYEDALDLTTAEDSEKEAVKRFSEDIDAGVGAKDYKITSSEVNGEKATVRIQVDGNEDKTIKLDLEKKSGKWLISGVVYSLNNTSTNQDTDESNSSERTSTVQTPAPQACLPAAALEKFWRYTAGWQFYFKADSNDLEYGDSGASMSVDEMKKFYDDNKQYNFAFVIDVSLYQATGSASDVQLAKDRAGVVAYNMNLRGIPYEYIRFGEARSGGDPNSSQYAAGSRNAWVSIDSDCSALESPQDFNASNVGR